jgi:hypothetical protein
LVPIWNGRLTLRDVDVRLAGVVVPYEDWDVLYRQRLQVELALRASARPPADTDGRGPIGFVADLIRRLAA